MLEVLEDTGRKIVMKNSKKYKHKKSETNQKTGDGIPYSKPDSRPFLHFFPENKLLHVNNWAKLLSVSGVTSVWNRYEMHKSGKNPALTTPLWQPEVFL